MTGRDLTIEKTVNSSSTVLRDKTLYPVKKDKRALAREIKTLPHGAECGYHWKGKRYVNYANRQQGAWGLSAGPGRRGYPGKPYPLM